MFTRVRYPNPLLQFLNIFFKEVGNQIANDTLNDDLGFIFLIGGFLKLKTSMIFFPRSPLLQHWIVEESVVTLSICFQLSN